MRILLVNKFYFPQGGADKHVLQLEETLKAHGHQVAVFAMAHPNNLPSEYAKYFVSNIDFSRVRFNWAGLRTVGRTLHSFEAARKMRQLIKDFRPDVVHIHNIYHQISPSILPVIRQAGIPIVQTLHDYALISANYNLYAHGGVCLHGRHGRFYEYVQHRCIKNSGAASLLAMIDQWWHARRRVYEKNIGTFISPSRFLRDMVNDWLGQQLNIKVLHNFIADDKTYLPAKKEPYIIYVGRLSEEKGIEVLLRALVGTDIKLKIVGTGPDETRLRSISSQLALKNVEWLGYRAGAELDNLIAQAHALVVPSKWYENCPLVILEAYARGTLVVAARMGGIPELVRDGETGYLYHADQENELRAALIKIMTDPETTKRLSQQAMMESEKYTLDKYYQQLLTIYETVRLH